MDVCICVVHFVSCDVLMIDYCFNIVLATSLQLPYVVYIIHPILLVCVCVCVF